MKKEVKDKWLQLYGMADEIAGFSPWVDFAENNPFCYIWKDKSKSVFFSFIYESIGRYGIACYVGEENYVRARERLTAENNKHEPIFMLQNALMCIWGDREDVSPENYRIIKELEFKFRGRGAWLCFEHYEIGYAPEPIREKELDLLIEAFGNLIMMLRAVYEHGVAPDFSNGDALVRWYEKKDDLYYTHPFKIDIDSKVINKRNLIFEENEHLRKIRAKSNERYSIEMDWAYLDEICEYNGRKIVPLLLLAVDKENGYILDNGMLSPDATKHVAVVNMLDGIMQKCGKPTEILVCDEEIKCILADICKKIGVKLSVKKRLPEIKRARNKMTL